MANITGIIPIGDYIFKGELVDLEKLPETSLNFTSNSKSYQKIYYESSLGTLVYYDGSNAQGVYVIDHGWTSKYKYINIAETQSVSAEFFEWFTANVKPKIIDLTDTVWEIPNGWSCSAGYGKFYINGHYRDAGWSCSFRYIEMGYDGWGNKTQGKICIDIECSAEKGEAFSLSINGGEDVTNPDLINWLTKYGELQKSNKPTEYGEIWYNGSLLITIKEGQTVTLHTNGKKTKTDIVIKGTKNFITFTIGETTYYAEEGMTWAEFITNPHYNIDNIVWASDGVVKYKTYNLYYNGEGISINEQIHSGHTYSYGSGSSAN